MLIEFKFSNFRSFKDETILSMNAMGISDFKESLLKHGSTILLPATAIYGKNGAGKSNVIRAFWLAVQFIKNSQRTQHEKAHVPVTPFALDDCSKSKPTEFEFTYVSDGIKYIYGFSADKEKIISEHLYHSPKGQKSKVFSRKGQNFEFPENPEKRMKQLISTAVAENQLFFSVACTMNYKPCINAMKWFREKIMFSRDFIDIPKQLIEYSNNQDMLKSIISYAKQADVGISDMSFEFSNKEISPKVELEVPDEIKNALSSFLDALSASANVSEMAINAHEIKAKSFHTGVASNGELETYELDLADESDGTRKLMALAPAIEIVLNEGGVFLIDEIEKEMHPMLVNFIVAKFQSKLTNKSKAQLIFTTHDAGLMNMQIIRKDQIYFTDKDHKTGASELYNLMEFSPATNSNIRKNYLLGKYGAIPNIDIPEVE
ncbi:MAG: ATP-binding protein [Clostridia bacterium]